MSSAAALYAELVAAFNGQRLDEALELAGRLTALAPEHPKAWHLLGLSRLMAGQVVPAKDALRQAARLLPDDAEVFDHLGVALNALGDFSAALDAHARSLDLDAQRPQSWLNAGKNLLDAGQLGGALNAYRQALKLNPGWAQAGCGLGDALRRQGESEAALGAYVSVLADEPHYVPAIIGRAEALVALDREAEAIMLLDRAIVDLPTVGALWGALGTLLFEADRHEDAVNCYEKALAADPNDLPTLVNFAATLLAMGRGAAAIPVLEHATRLNPLQAQAWANLGAAYVSANRRPEGRAAYDQALKQGGGQLPAIHNNFGDLLRDLGELTSAERHFTQAIALYDHYVEARIGLGTVLLEQGRADDAINAFRTSLKIDPTSQLAASNLLYASNFLRVLDRADYRQALEQFGRMLGDQAKPFTSWSAPADATRAPRIGFVSGDLLSHPVGYFLRDVLLALRDAGLSTIAYYNHTVEDAVTDQIRRSVSALHLVAGLSDAQLAQQIHRDEIDILVDLSGHTARNRLSVFAWKAAPVQVSWMSFASTGVAEIDYFIADRKVLTPAQRADFVETPIFMPDSYYCFSAPEVDLAPAPLPMLRNGYPTFGCYNRISKLNDQVIALWSALLQRIPKARLVLKATQFNDPDTAAAIARRFDRHGIGAERLLLDGPSSRADYLAAYAKIDVALDPFPFAGGTTSIEGLWMGVPVLTLAGDRMAGRQGVSILGALGMADWVAEDEAGYLDIAERVVSDRAALAQLRASLRPRLVASPLFDAAKFSGHLAEVFQNLWRAHCQPESGIAAKFL